MSRPPKFKPGPKVSEPRRHINLDITPELYDQVEALAKRNKISMREFGRQALEYAIENIDKRRR